MNPVLDRCACKDYQAASRTDTTLPEAFVSHVRIWEEKAQTGSSGG
ncbi:hypothetical protein [Rhabdochromatium marinum]|nr:hypothetical protein [Rhabdochromatium marinum]